MLAMVIKKTTRDFATMVPKETHRKGEWKPRNRLGQMKIQQMAFLIIAISVFFVLVGILVLVITLSGINQTAKSLSEENTLALVSKLANSPELSCGNAFTAKTNCIDLDKAILLSGNNDYNDFWGVAKIEIRRISPNMGETICSLVNINNCGIINIVSKDVKTLPPSSNYVSLCIKEPSVPGMVYDKCEIGLLTIYSEDKTNA
jgi:hypothetical protein